MMNHFATLTPDAPSQDAVQRLLDANQSEFPVGNEAGKLVGLLSRGDLVRALNQRGQNARVADAMTTSVPTIGNRRWLEDAMRMLQEKAAPAVAVIDDAGLGRPGHPGDGGEMLMEL